MQIHKSISPSPSPPIKQSTSAPIPRLAVLYVQPATATQPDNHNHRPTTTRVYTTQRRHITQDAHTPTCTDIRITQFTSHPNTQPHTDSLNTITVEFLCENKPGEVLSWSKWFFANKCCVCVDPESTPVMVIKWFNGIKYHPGSHPVPVSSGFHESL